MLISPSRSRFYEEIDKGNLDAVDELIAKTISITAHTLPGLPAGREGLKHGFRIFWQATPGYQEISDQIAEGDKVVTRLSCFSTRDWLISRRLT